MPQSAGSSVDGSERDVPLLLGATAAAAEAGPGAQNFTLCLRAASAGSWWDWMPEECLQVSQHLWRSGCLNSTRRLDLHDNSTARAGASDQCDVERFACCAQRSDQPESEREGRDSVGYDPHIDCNTFMFITHARFFTERSPVGFSVSFRDHTITHEAPPARCPPHARIDLGCLLSSSSRCLM